jgi:hypothetical protein
MEIIATISAVIGTAAPPPADRGRGFIAKILTVGR